ncbi:hypothetical protein GWI33_019688 [Rhynchophorus ferrugineus]|uniref:Uncharacterized protein n=1 Tax=Rhynchophorus ferrugineus TaxID=354439 RepID=A0A834M515_RHYFE|nr:hypothetical protein GWI33_019688 [Rhynchophorus ferrugineus]
MDECRASGYLTPGDGGAPRRTPEASYPGKEGGMRRWNENVRFILPVHSLVSALRLDLVTFSDGYDFFPSIKC